MIDIHAHILPEMDDGARDIYDTLKMARIAAESGITAMVATPHCNLPDMYRKNYFSDEYIDVFESTVRTIKKEGIPLELYPGMEVFATENLPDLLVDKRIMPINQSRYVLIEFNFDEDPMFATRLLMRVKEVGAKPVVAHVERYEFVQDNPQLLCDWWERGFYTQVNKNSFMGSFGGDAQKTAFELMDHRLVSVIASDAHGSRNRTPYMKDIYEGLQLRYEKEYLDRMFIENPRRICNNQVVLVERPVPFR